MKKIYLLLITIVVSNSLFAQGLSSTQSLFATNFISLTVPQDYQGTISYLNASNTVEKRFVNQLPHNSCLLGSFPNLVSSVTLYQMDENGTLSLIGNSLTAKKSTYIVVYDFAQTQTIHLRDSAEKLSYYALVGVSVRMVARVNANSAGINLADIFSLGIAANKNKLSGSLEVRVNGINSQQINSIIPVTTDLSASSISNALQAVATIKSHIYDDSTKITPQFLAFSVVGNQNETNTGGTKFSFKKLTEMIGALKLD
jgi:hypothetical protein